MMAVGNAGSIEIDQSTIVFRNSNYSILRIKVQEKLVVEILQ